MNVQTLVIRLEPQLARRVRSFLRSSAHGYESLDEFVEVALENQLNMEGQPTENGPSDAAAGRDVPPPTGITRVGHVADELGRLKTLLERPGVSAPLPVAEEGPRFGVLSVFTNRLSPIKVAARVLANMAMGSSEWPAMNQFREESAAAARYLGQRLREPDGNAPTVRRWVAYPIGSDAEKAKTRFANSFTLTETDATASGPMVTLGLSRIVDGRVALTRAGWRLAAAPSPLMDASDGITLSPAEAEILRTQLKQSPDEVAVVREFLELLRESRGRQERLDELLAEDHPAWTKEFLVAQRSAMLGRLSDLAALEVNGRGLTATIELLPAAAQLEAAGAR